MVGHTLKILSVCVCDHFRTCALTGWTRVYYFMFTTKSVSVKIFKGDRLKLICLNVLNMDTNGLFNVCDSGQIMINQAAITITHDWLKSMGLTCLWIN